ncbi:uncharacterized protein LOC132723962 [Ruditapes philippinarum]|uniref:uncharacterized protein LOC132723962 n=1 Tax=Ruditapes philippinarum TaxID=129788 RepID=UPI00295C25B3|nr:uncharacterized protein LOC132723962 [Ruditapes philippinarum]
MRICDSRAWDSDFRNDLERYPKYNYRNRTESEYLTGKQHSRNTGPPKSDNCQACIHPWRVKLQLDGEPYYKNTFKKINNDNGTPDVYRVPVVHYIGTGCCKRSKLYHEIFHFGHALYHKCMTMIEIMVEKGIEEVLFEEMSQKLNRLIRRAKRYRSKKQKASIFDDWSSFWKAVSDI